MPKRRRKKLIDVLIRWSAGTAERFASYLKRFAVGRQRVLVDVLDFAHELVAASRDLGKLDQTVMDLSKERAILLAQQPELGGARPVREGALGEIHGVRG